MHGRVERVISILVKSQSELKGYQIDGLEQAPRLVKKEDNTARLHRPHEKRL